MINKAFEDLPRELVRLHLCGGSWHGPHSTDIELKEILKTVLIVNAAQISFEAASARHEHEWCVWEENQHLLADDRVLVPGVVSHATKLIELPEPVADRIERFAKIVGPERVIASTDCGLGGRVHPDIAWAKLEAFGEGARIAAKRVYRSARLLHRGIRRHGGSLCFVPCFTACQPSPLKCRTCTEQSGHVANRNAFKGPRPVVV